MAVRQWSVILLDRQPQRRARIRQLVNALGACAIEIFDVQRALFSSACCVAVVGSRQSSLTAAGINAIRNLKQQGFEIVAYEDGAESGA